MKILLPLMISSSFAGATTAEDITTVDGKQFKDVQEIKVHPDGLSFFTSLGPQSVDFLNLPADMQAKYHYNAFDAGVARGMKNKPGTVKKGMALSLDQLEQAKAKAQEAHRLLGFLLLWDQMYDKPSRPMDKGGNNAALHFYNTFKDSLQLVFLSHERDLGKLPPMVAKGILGPDEGGFSPCLCVVSADLADYVVMIPLGGAMSDGKIRQDIFTDKIAVIKAYLDKKP